MKTWTDVIGQEKEKPYFKHILQQVHQERLAGKTIYPPQDEVFNAFKYTAFDEVKVVILGQDPYHGPNQAHGLAFSVKPEIAIPPSLLNMYKELANDIPGFKMPNHGYLVKWAEQGVLLLNTVLYRLFRKRIDPRYEGYVHMAGLAALMCLMLVVTLSDVGKLFGR